MNKDIRNIAAIDLGSNSFHMVVAKVIDQDLQLISKHKQRVRLSEGLDADNHLSEAYICRGLDCLTMFAERVKDFQAKNVRIAATQTLRQAVNADEFIRRAAEIIPFPIEVISGEEEARLIYLGVAHTQTVSHSKLVVDIGGGSTEFVIGKEFDAELTHSIAMGSATFTKRFFSTTQLSRHNFVIASLAAEQELEPVRKKYVQKGWEIALGSSGSIKLIRDAMIKLGHPDGIITQKRLDKLLDKLCLPSPASLSLIDALPEDKQPILPAALSILLAVFRSFNIKEMHYSEGALREGLLYEMEQRFKRIDIRMRTIDNLAKKHQVDLEHALKVKGQAQLFFQQVASPLGLDKHPELLDLLQWSALLHEVGLSINLQGVHRHSAYILRNTPMPGFNRDQQLLIANLARFQRKAFKLNELEDFTLFKKKQVIQLIKLLRLAVITNSQRNGTPLDSLHLSVSEEVWTLTCTDPCWLKHNRLLNADLLTEQDCWRLAGWTLIF